MNRATRRSAAAAERRAERRADIAGAVYGRPGRDLAEEQLDDLELLSRREQPIAVGGEA